jgi:hypothetical protein
LVMICIMFHVALSDQNEFNVFFCLCIYLQALKKFLMSRTILTLWLPAICFLKECHSASSLVLASCIIYIVPFSQSKKCLMIYATIVQCIFA